MIIDRHPHNNINFCHIAPTKFLADYTSTNGAHLLLAHLVEEDPAYADYYANLNDGRLKILDNSAFEMFKRGQEMYPSNKLVEMGKKCKADVIVLSDYPRMPWQVTVDAAHNLIPEFKDAGFGTFFVPQSELGDVDGILKSYQWALENEEVDLIGVSILGCPTAFNIVEQKYDSQVSDPAFRLQRFLSRWKMFRTLEDAGLLQYESAIKRFHCLGMTDGPQEIDLLKEYTQYIYSWDSSAAVWAGLNGVKFDTSPSGLRYGKVESEVDFGYAHDVQSMRACVMNNIQVIDNLCQK